MHEDFKARTLAHCLSMAKVDPIYAIWAAREYERSMPWLLNNLARKVEQAIERSRASARAGASGRAVSGSA